MTNLVKISTAAGKPLMHKDVAPRFEQLRKTVLEKSGVDFLAKCGDVLRDPGFVSSKDGVADRSWHKTGRAFDYDQESGAIVIVSEPIGGRQFFRTYLRCAHQDGSQGKAVPVRDIRGFKVSSVYLVDFTELAEAAGFHRIPAWNGWQTHYNRKEFWHYQRDEGLTWDAAMQQIKDGAPAAVKKAIVAGGKIIGTNDRDSNTAGRVSQIQGRLNALGFLAPKQIDGIYGKFTTAGIRAFQKANHLGVDGTVGPKTAAAMGIQL